MKKRGDFMPEFSKSVKQLLEKNPNILEVSSQISYTFKFKKEAVKAYSSGTSPKEIFRRADIDLSLFSAKYAKSSVWRWVKIVEKYGIEGIERRTSWEKRYRPSGQNEIQVKTRRDSLSSGRE